MCAALRGFEEGAQWPVVTEGESAFLFGERVNLLCRALTWRVSVNVTAKRNKYRGNSSRFLARIPKQFILAQASVESHVSEDRPLKIKAALICSYDLYKSCLYLLDLCFLSEVKAKMMCVVERVDVWVQLFTPSFPQATSFHLTA